MIDPERMTVKEYYNILRHMREWVCYLEQELRSTRMVTNVAEFSNIDYAIREAAKWADQHPEQMKKEITDAD